MEEVLVLVSWGLPAVLLLVFVGVCWQTTGVHVETQSEPEVNLGHFSEAGHLIFETSLSLGPGVHSCS